VWSSGIDDVWVVGGREGIGNGPVAYHFDGTAWTAHDTGLLNVDLWQVFGFRDGPVFIGGSNGTLLRFQNGTFEKLPTPSTDIVFGLWGTSPSDVWAVGGQTQGNPFVWRSTGGAFESVPGIPAALSAGTVWKVTGRSATDVYMSASEGLVLHWDGTQLTNEPAGKGGEQLFSIGCTQASCVTAGTNTTNGVLYESSGSGWTSRVPTEDGPVWRGVTQGEQRYVVGATGAVIQNVDGTWKIDPHGLTTKSLHAAWADEDGNVFVAGGDFDRAITTDGVLLYKGTRELPPLP
jgi:hypothetical protein